MDNEASQLAAIQEVFDASADRRQPLTAVGYAVGFRQPGRSDARSALMSSAQRGWSMRDLAEQIHGIAGGLRRQRSLI